MIAAKTALLFRHLSSAYCIVVVRISTSHLPSGPCRLAARHSTWPQRQASASVWRPSSARARSRVVLTMCAPSTCRPLPSSARSSSRDSLRVLTHQPLTQSPAGWLWPNPPRGHRRPLHVPRGADCCWRRCWQPHRSAPPSPLELAQAPTLARIPHEPHLGHSLQSAMVVATPRSFLPLVSPASTTHSLLPCLPRLCPPAATTSALLRTATPRSCWQLSAATSTAWTRSSMALRGKTRTNATRRATPARGWEGVGGGAVV